MSNLFQLMKTRIIDNKPPVSEKPISEQSDLEHPILTQPSSYDPTPLESPILAHPNSDRDFSDADQDPLPSPADFYSTLGLAITILGLILFAAPTSGKTSRLIGFVQSLLGSILVTLSL